MARSHSPAHRGQRSNGGNPRALHRGGVQKRGRSSTRTDRDGDTNMDPNSAWRGRGRGRGAFSHNPQTHGVGDPFRKHRGNHSANQRGPFRGRSELSTSKGSQGPSSLDQLIVRGLRQSKAASNSDGGVKDLVAFLERKASPRNGETIKVKKSHRNGDDVIISVRPEDTVSFLRVNNYAFAGATILVEIHQRGILSDSYTISPEAAEVEGVLNNVLNKRYNQAERLLDLSKLGDDPDLLNTGLIDNKNRISKIFAALMSVCDKAFDSMGRKDEAIVSISLADNDIPNVGVVVSLADTFPNIKNLDLSGNRLRNAHSLEKWKFGFRQLEYLQLDGNPIENETDFMATMMSRYPKLRSLGTNQQSRATQHSALSNQHGIQLRISPHSFRDEADIAKNFLLRFFPRYDTDRSGVLKDSYDATSTFSLSVNTEAPRGQIGIALPAPFTDYIAYSRNLKKLKSTQPRMDRLYKGRENIDPVWNSLAATRHPDMIQESDKWCLECHSLPGVPDTAARGGVNGLIIVVHGEFEDLSSRRILSFDRTFVLGPGQGIGGVRVVSDVLVLRPYGGYEIFKPTTIESTPQSISKPQNVLQNSTGAVFGNSQLPDPSHLVYDPLAAQSALQRIMQSHTPESLALPENFGLRTSDKTEEQLAKETMIMQLTTRTQMTIQYSDLCLTQNGWSLEQAEKDFEAVKGTLPAEAFLPFRLS